MKTAMIHALFALACRATLLLACAVTAIGLVLLGLGAPAFGWVLLGLAAWWKYRRRPLSDSYGSAAVASLPQMNAGGLLAEDGLILGRCLADRPALAEGFRALLSPAFRPDLACRMFLAAAFSRRWLGGRLLRVRNHVHLLTCSPAGGGKGVGVLIPNLLSYPGNCVVVDPKGELFRETAEHRRRQFGHRIIRLDPFGVCGPGGDTLNPFDFIDARAADFVDQLADLADQIVIRQHDEKEPHWNESAIKNVKAFGSFVCGAEKDPAKRHLGTVRALTASRGKFARAIEVMQQMGDACQGVLARLGGDLTWHEGEELASVMATLGRHLNFLDSPVMARSLASSSFDPQILRTGKATIFLILPHDRLSSHSRWLRLMIGTILRRSTRGAPTERNPVLWLLDEFAHVGHMQAIEDAATLMRGMGVRLWFIFQSLAQVKGCFGEKAQVVLDNCGTQQFFAINSYETAEYISKRIGDATIRIASLNDTRGHSYPTAPAGNQGGNRSDSTSTTTSEIARRLLKEDEILRLNPKTCIIFHKNLPVCLGGLVRFFEAPEFRRRRFGFGPRGTARPRRLGLAAGLLALSLLAVSGFVTARILAAAGLAAPRGATGDLGGPGAAFVLPPPLPPGYTAPASRARRLRARGHGRAGGSGDLIRIE